MPTHDENEITPLDRQIADQVAGMFDDGTEPDYEWSANVRRGLESALLYTQVHGLSFMAGQSLVLADDHERYSQENNLLTPAVTQALAELRRLAWTDADPETLGEALMASFNLIHEERMRQLKSQKDYPDSESE